jgi:hypothetical protein
LQRLVVSTTTGLDAGDRLQCGVFVGTTETLSASDNETVSF